MAKDKGSSELSGVGALDKGMEDSSDKADGNNDAKKKLEEQQKKIKELESEKEELSDVIEEMSSSSADEPDPPAKSPPPQQSRQPQPPPPAGPDVKAAVDGIEKKFNDQMKAVNESIKSISEKIEKGDKKSGGADVRKIVSKMQESTDDKISALEGTLKDLSEKVSAPPAPPTKGGEDVSKGLSAFGETMDFKDELIQVKNSVRRLKEDMDSFRETTETKILRLNDQAKEIGKLSNLEERVEFLNEKFGPENIEKLNNLVISARELEEKVIPKMIDSKMGEKVVPLYKKVERMKDNLVSENKKLSSTTNQVSKMKTGFKEIENIQERLSKMEEEKKELSESLKDKDSELKDLIDKRGQEEKELGREMGEKINALRDSIQKSMKEQVGDLFKDFSESKIAELEDKSTKNLVIAKEQVNDMISRITKLENYFRPTLKLIDDRLGEMEERVNEFEDQQKDFGEEMDESIKSKFKEVVDSRLDDMEKNMMKMVKSNKDNVDSIDSKFSQFEDVVNPTIKMFGDQLNKFESSVEKFKGNQDDFKDSITGMKSDLGDLQETVRSLTGMKGLVERIENKTGEIDEIKEAVREVKRKSNSDKRELLSDISGINKGLDFLNALGKDTNQHKKAIGEIRENISDINGKIKTLKAQFDNVITRSLQERREMMEASRKQKDQINGILKELKNL